LGLFLATSVSADTPPGVPEGSSPGVSIPSGIPNLFYGLVSYENGTTPDDLTVEAKIGDVVVESSITKDGKYGYTPTLFKVTDPANDRGGEIISFFVDGVDSGETSIFENGGSIRLDLTLSGDAPGTSSYVPPTPPANPGGGGGGGGGGGSSAGDTSQNLVGDINKDLKVDKYDFSLLMSYWGQSVSGLAVDLNGDGKVDKYDFALLMLNWGK